MPPRLAWSVAVLAAAGCAHRAAGPGAEQRPIVAEVRIEGNASFGDDELLEGLATRETGRWPWSERRRLDPLALGADERRLETFYGLRGYLAARATHAVEPLDGRVRVVFRVEEGAPFRIASITVEGIGELAGDLQRRLAPPPPLRVGEVVRAEDYQRARARLLRELREAGHAAAEVDGTVEVFAERREAEITLRATPGPLHRYGEIEVTGLAAIPADPIRAIARRELPRGRTFRPADVEAAQTRLLALGALRSARITLDPPAEDGGEATVRLSVAELPVHGVVLGGGVGVEQNIQQAQVIAEYRNTNVLGGAQRLAWRNELAMRFLPSFVERDRLGLDAQTSVELTQPEVLARTDLSARAAYQRVFRPAFEANAVSARLGLPRHLTRRLQLSPALGYTRYLDVVERRPIGPLPLPLPAACPSPCQVAALSARLASDSRDDVASAHRGHLATLEGQYAFPLPNGGARFLRMDLEGRLYLPLSRRTVLATRARLGALRTLAGEPSPLPQRFFGGGEGGHRGFGPEQLAPTIEDAPGSFAPIGGEGLWLASVEARVRAFGSLGFVTFADYGDVTADALRVDLSTAHLAVGAGARYYTPVGPVRLDVAYRLPRRERTALDTGTPVETSPADYLTFFLSIGEAF